VSATAFFRTRCARCPRWSCSTPRRREPAGGPRPRRRPAGHPRSPVRVRAQRRAIPDGRRPAAPAGRREGARHVCGFRTRRPDQPRGPRGHGRDRNRPLPRVPQAAHHRCGAGRRRGDHDGLRRRLPRLPRKALPRLGPARPGGPGPGGRPADP
jgi:hypothetical protein